MLKAPASAGLFVILGGICLTAQTGARFEVTSVRPNTSGETRASMQFTPAGDFTAVNQPVRVLLNFAYQIPLFRVEGMPDWFTTERFDVGAKAPAGLSIGSSAELRGQLLRGLLEERFSLKARLVTKEIPAMVLTLTRQDLSTGPRFRKSDVDCALALAAGRGNAAGPRQPVCALAGGSGRGTICGRAVTMEQVTQGLSGVYQRPVVDMTGLYGRFDFDLTFTPDNPGGPGVAFGGGGCGDLSGDRPALATALQEQLGLRIASGRAPVEVLVIDSAARPTAN